MNYFKLLIQGCILILPFALLAQHDNPFQFVSPKPASIGVSDETNIIFRSADQIDPSTLSDNGIHVKGSLSGLHKGALILSDDERTLIFNPDAPFAPGEDVSVVLMKGLKTGKGDDIPVFSYNFQTSPKTEVQMSREKKSAEAYLPAPVITINTINDPSEGYIFMATWDRNVPAKYGNFIFILDKNGAIVDSVRVKGAPYDFQVQPNGLLSYALGDYTSNVPLPGEDLQHMVLDENLALVDSFKMKNGYLTDFHEFRMMPNGHVMMMSYHTVTYDMSTIVEGGKTDASLVINIIQEQDREKNVVFEWRNIDYIPITDSDLNLTDARINYGTLNAFDIDDDGNILASFRNHSEIMKISRETGEVIWRMGGPRSNFTYVGEHEENAPYYHARQHNIRRRPNGNITMFDNGEFHQPPYSRAVEYSLDEVNKVATLVSEWRYPDGNIFCVTAGNAEPLSGGGWFIGYGVPNPQFVKRNAVEVHEDGSVALELSLPMGVLAYRAYKLPWKESVKKQSFTHFEVKAGNNYSYNGNNISTGVEIYYNALDAADYNESTITRLPYGPVHPEFIESMITIYPVSLLYEGFAITTQTAEFQIDMTQFPEVKDPGNTILYYREFPGRGLFIPVSTTYDSLSNKINGTPGGFGEIVFGIPEEAANGNIPILYEPLNQQKLLLKDEITVRWTGKGFYNSFNVQLSADSTFASVIQESGTNLSHYAFSGLSNNTTYYWRVSSVLDSNPGEWSPAWSFSITDPFINTVSPDGGEVWTTGNREIIRWETNITGEVHIDLLMDEQYMLSLDTVRGSVQAYAWVLPAAVQAGDNYRIRISDASDPLVFGLSENVFSITDSATSNAGQRFHSGYNLEQNVPNPFARATKISYSIPESEFVTLCVYDLSGRKICTLVNDFREAGSYSVDFDASPYAAGFYFYKLEVGNAFRELKRMMLIR